MKKIFSVIIYLKVIVPTMATLYVYTQSQGVGRGGNWKIGRGRYPAYLLPVCFFKKLT